MENFCIIDLETNGLINPEVTEPYLQPGIVEVGLIICNYETLQTFEESSWLVNPEQPLDLAAMSVHKIPEEEILSANPFSIVGFDVAEAMMGVHDLIGFNHIEFDNIVLEWQLKRYGMERNFPWPIRHIDLMAVGKEYMNIKGKQGNKPPNLMELYRHLFGKEFEGHHRALSDCRATLDCYVKMMELEWI